LCPSKACLWLQWRPIGGHKIDISPSGVSSGVLRGFWAESPPGTWSPNCDGIQTCVEAEQCGFRAQEARKPIPIPKTREMANVGEAGNNSSKLVRLRLTIPDPWPAKRVGPPQNYFLSSSLRHNGRKPLLWHRYRSAKQRIFKAPPSPNPENRLK